MKKLDKTGGVTFPPIRDKKPASEVQTAHKNSRLS